MADFIHPTTQPRLTPPQIEYMLMHAMRTPEVFNVAKTRLKPDHFRLGDEGHYRLAWETTLKIVKERGVDFLLQQRMQAYEAIWQELDSRVQNEPNLLDQNIVNELLNQPRYGGEGLLHRIFMKKSFDPPAAIGYLRIFLMDREVQSHLKKIIENADNNLVMDLPSILQSVRDKAVSLEGMEDDPVSSGAPENWVPTKLGKTSTGVEFIDKMTRGGHAPGEVYGVIGAFASGKTSLAVQLTANCGFYWQQFAEEETKRTGKACYPKECYCFHYEAPRDEILVRLWSNVCTIDHEYLEEFDWDKLTTIKNGYNKLRDYEKRYWKEQKQLIGSNVIVGERERLEMHMPLLRRNIWFVDMSGVPDNPKRGTGYVQEIRAIIENDLRKKEQKSGRKHEVGCIVIDYAGQACRRYMTEHGIPFEHMRHYVGSFGGVCRNELATVFKCPVWVFHQLQYEANKRNYQIRQHFSDAAEAKNFAEHLSFCFALGTKNEEDGTLLFTCSKARRTNIGNPTPLMLEGKFYRLVVAKDHIWDPKSQTVVAKSIAAISGTEVAENSSGTQTSMTDQQTETSTLWPDSTSEPTGDGQIDTPINPPKLQNAQNLPGAGLSGIGDD
jgi:hypothetical protein